MLASVLIPTRGRAKALARCVDGLARQSVDPAQYEVVIGFDGPDPEGRAAAEAAWTAAGGRTGGLLLEECPRRGYIDVRHRMLPELSGEFLVSMNDDVEPEPGFLDAHLRGQRGGAAVVVGDSRFVAWDRPTLLDRLLDETGMVFFYHAMTAGSPDQDWGFRHCFGLNLSAPLECVRAAGGFPSMPDTYGYDDIELGYRLKDQFGLPVRYRPAARAPHRHRYRAADVLEREHALGVAAVRYARHHPEFARAVFGRDILDEREIDFCRAQTERDETHAPSWERAFLRLDEIPADAIDGEHASALRELIYQQHLPLKRHRWRRGVLRELKDMAGAGAGAGAPA